MDAELICRLQYRVMLYVDESEKGPASSGPFPPFRWLYCSQYIPPLVLIFTVISSSCPHIF